MKFSEKFRKILLSSDQSYKNKNPEVTSQNLASNSRRYRRTENIGTINYIVGQKIRAKKVHVCNRGRFVIDLLANPLSEGNARAYRTVDSIWSRGESFREIEKFQGSCSNEQTVYFAFLLEKEERNRDSAKRDRVLLSQLFSKTNELSFHRRRVPGTFQDKRVDSGDTFLFFFFLSRIELRVYSMNPRQDFKRSSIGIPFGGYFKQSSLIFTLATAEIRVPSALFILNTRLGIQESLVSMH